MFITPKVSFKRATARGFKGMTELKNQILEMVILFPAKFCQLTQLIKMSWPLIVFPLVQSYKKAK